MTTFSTTVTLSIELPSSFISYNSGSLARFARIYCGNKDEWNFLCKAIVHRTNLEDVIKKLDSDRDERATKAIVNEVVNYFGSNMEKLHEKSNTQIEYLAEQSESLVKFPTTAAPDVCTLNISGHETAT